MLFTTLFLLTLPWLSQTLPVDDPSSVEIRAAGGCGEGMHACGGGCIPYFVKCGQHISDEKRSTYAAEEELAPRDAAGGCGEGMHACNGGCLPYFVGCNSSGKRDISESETEELAPRATGGGGGCGEGMHPCNGGCIPYFVGCG
ncbi:unnamed protein product [Cercospora beticola]|nr:unnamed protein product [Cercospora beticola]